MMRHVYFIHANGIREYTQQGVRELCEPIPMLSEYVFDYAKMLRDFADTLTGVSPGSDPLKKS